jgi:hypothetical protein
MTTITLSLVSHTNVGKTTLARTLLARDVGEVRDAPHVTEFAEEHLLIESPGGHRLMLWDTPGFGDSVRLARRMAQSAQPLGWLLSQAWDRWRDRPFWMSQQALRHVRAASDLLLYLVNASEPDAGYLQSELQLIGWTGKPAIVLLNQLGVPRAAADEAADLERWRKRLAPWPFVREVLPLDAFARCWVHEQVLLRALRDAFSGQAFTADAARAAAMAELAAAWSARREQQFEQTAGEIAAGLVRIALKRETVDQASGLAERVRDWGQRKIGGLGGLGGVGKGDDPASLAEQRLAAALDAEVRGGTQRLLALHGLQGQAGDQAVRRILERVAVQVESHRRLPEGRAAVLGGALTGALAGLKADLATGGLTLGGGLLAGGLLGALGAAGVARGINVVRGTDRSWVAWAPEALATITETALLRYLAVAHYGRGRGHWAGSETDAEAPPHWPAAVAEAIAPRREAFEHLWRSRPDRANPADEATRLTSAVQPLVVASLRDVLAALYPQAAAAGGGPEDNALK